MFISTCLRRSAHLLAAVTVFALVGCTVEGDDDDAADDRNSTWDEGSSDNTEPWDAESVDDDWQDSVTITGSMEDCAYSQGEDWEYTADNDSFEIEVPADGFMAADLTWESNSDLDMYIYINGGGDSWSPDDSETRNGDAPESWVPDDEFESGDDIVFTIVCSQGSGGDYTLVVGWES